MQLYYYLHIYFEKLMHKRLDKYPSTNNLLCSHQFGSKKDLCTDTAYDTINVGDKFIAIFLDFSKAFDTRYKNIEIKNVKKKIVQKKDIDTINIGIFLAKLYRMGIRGNIHCWFRSCLSE